MTKKSRTRLAKDRAATYPEITRLQAAIGLLHLRVKNLEQAMLDAAPAELKEAASEQA